MNHIEAIEKYIQALQSTSDLNILVIEGPPGWGKTTAVEKALALSKVEAQYEMNLLVQTT